ncbi:hypothetical protein FQZ97_1223110 [compost metagenome]
MLEHGGRLPSELARGVGERVWRLIGKADPDEALLTKFLEGGLGTDHATGGQQRRAEKAQHGAAEVSLFLHDRFSLNRNLSVGRWA